MIGTAVLGVITTICAIIAGFCAIALRFTLFWYGNRQFSFSDDNSKLCGVIAGILFGFGLALWVKVPHHENSQDQS